MSDVIRLLPGYSILHGPARSQNRSQIEMNQRSLFQPAECVRAVESYITFAEDCLTTGTPFSFVGFQAAGTRGRRILDGERSPDLWRDDPRPGSGRVVGEPLGPCRLS
jgi:hypothetical protein